MKHSVKADIYYDGKFWCGRCLDIDVFTQGKSLDELSKMQKEDIIRIIKVDLSKNPSRLKCALLSLEVLRKSLASNKK